MLSVRPFPLLVLLCAFAFSSTQAADAPRWWRGNLHTHSLWSDGNDYPEMIADWYKAHGYHFLGLSDHNIIADHEKWVSIAKNKGGEQAFQKYVARFGKPWVETREADGGPEVRLKMLSELRVPLEAPGRFLLIPMEEITAPTVHINATNLREKILPYTGGSKALTSEGVVKAMQYAVGAVLEQRTRLGVPMFPHINHPNFKWALTAEEMLQVKDEQFFEVYNGHPTVYNGGDAQHASTDRVWDIVLTMRLGRLGQGPLYGLATDDAHHYHNQPKQMSRTGRGWIMVRAASLQAEALIAAMEAGDFYASSGVILRDVRREKNALALEIEPQPGVTYSTEFIGTRKGFNAESQPVLGPEGQPLRVTRNYSADVGAVLAKVEGTSARYELKGDELYVRARVTSSRTKTDPAEEDEKERAWTQPLVAPKTIAAASTR
jgi:hypothetical protein